jgi:phospholipid/cholesterol/gamma-HCH transport system substrate-binding protein
MGEGKRDGKQGRPGAIVKRSTSITWDELRVGLLVLAAVGTLLLAIYKLGETSNLFTKRYTLYVFLANARGISRGGSVTVDGVVAGTITDVRFLPVDNDTTRNLRLSLSIDRRLQPQVRADSRAELRALGLLGDKILDISSGTPRYNMLQPGDTIPVVPSIDVDDVIAEASVVVQDLVQLTGDLKSITGGIVHGDGTMGQLVTNRSLYDQLTGTLTRVDALLARFENPRGTVGRLVDDPQLYNALLATVSGVDSVLGQLTRRQGTAGRLLYDDTLYTRLLATVTGTDSFLRQLNGGRGAAGKLLRDEHLYDQLTQAISSLNAILLDVKQNPRRYTRGMVKVF